MFNDLIKKTSAEPNKPIQTNSKGAKEVFTGGNESVNLGGMGFRKDNGEFVPFKNINLPASAITTSNSRTYFDPNKKMHFMTANITVPLEQATEMLQNVNPVNDPIMNWFLPKSMESYGIESGFGKSAEIFDQDGVKMVNMQITKPIESTNNQTNAAYDHGAGQGMSKYESKQAVSVSALIQEYGEQGAKEIISANEGKYNFVP